MASCIKCNYLRGYGPEVEISVVKITPVTDTQYPYFNITAEDGVEYPVTWLEWDRGEMMAGCFENF